MNYRKLLVASILLVAASAFSFIAGVFYTMNGMSNELQATQAMISFNHLNRYLEIEGCLRKRNINGAGEKIANSIISERELLADLLGSTKSDWLNEYIEARSSESVDSLKSFKSKRGNTWSEPSC